MKERPILFSAPMVRAILAGTKTQTRRVVKNQPEEDKHGHGWIWRDKRLDAGYCHTNREPMERLMEPLCPYGVPGDRLWVRESWGGHFMWDTVRPASIPNDGKSCLFYQADGAIVGGCTPTQRKRWRPSIHMPRWMSRITLELTAIRVERLQNITEADAIAEGSRAPCGDFKPTLQGCLSERAAYKQIWERINGAGSWDLNPWVWVVEFKRVDG